MCPQAFSHNSAAHEGKAVGLDGLFDASIDILRTVLRFAAHFRSALLGYFSRHFYFPKSERWSNLTALKSVGLGYSSHCFRKLDDLTGPLGQSAGRRS